MVQLISQLEVLGFVESGGRWVYTSPGGYEISVVIDAEDPRRSKIGWGKEIVVHHKSTSSFRQAETIVVVACVCSLLGKGYEPKHIELEKTWPLGHREKGRLDVLLRSPESDAYALIECKTWGREYQKERNATLEDGGQLFSYFTQERSARALYLFTAQLTTEVSVLAEFVRTAGLDGSNMSELFASWDGSLEPSGLFHPDASTYDDAYRGIRADDLRELDRESGVGVFNSFAEILRRNVISDKSNAFNKIFSLFLCKIADEDQHSGAEEMAFQWRVGDDVDSLMDRLSALYLVGVRDYIGVIIDPDRHSPLAEFAFIDIYDEPTYQANAQVVRETVELLQPFRVKYSSRHQHLGDFFEMLLTTGVKQEAGQFFTPVPLVDGILKSLPLESITQQKIENRALDVLPFVLDFACGAGHFLTQAIEQIQKIVEAIEVGDLRGQQRSRFVSGSSDLMWAREYIYGVEKDYRLAKVTKVATFLNGDGLANIVRADGLGAFNSETGFTGLLRTATPSIVNHKFDVIASNPPYAVPNFATTLDAPQTRFRLAKYLTSISGEIECLFLERAWQQLNEGGVAGILFPLSLLQNGKPIYQAARRLLASQFRIVGLVELRDHTFVATSTTTVCLFVERRRSSEIAAATARLAGMAHEPELLEVLEAAGVDGEAVVEAMAGKRAADLEESAYESDALAHAIRVLADQGRMTVLAFAGDTVKAQERFLGYRFSKTRGTEGLQVIDDGVSIQTHMYSVLDDGDPSKVSTHIRANFMNETLAVPEEAASYLQVVSSESLWKVGGVISNPSSFFVTAANVVSYSPYGDFIDGFESDVVSLGSFIDGNGSKVVRGASYQKRDEVPTPTSRRVLTAANVDLASRRLTFSDYRYLKETVALSDDIKPRAGDLVVCIASGSLRHLGKIAAVTEATDAYIGGFLSILRSSDPDVRKILEYNLLSRRFREFVAGMKEQNISNLTEAKLRAFPIVVPRDRAAFISAAAELEAE